MEGIIFEYILENVPLKKLSVILIIIYMLVFMLVYKNNLKKRRYLNSFIALTSSLVFIIFCTIIINDFWLEILSLLIFVFVTIECLMMIKHPLLYEKFILRKLYKMDIFDITNDKSFLISSVAKLRHKILIAKNLEHHGKFYDAIKVIDNIDGKGLLENEIKHLNSLRTSYLIRLNNIKAAKIFVENNILHEDSKLFFKSLIAEHELEIKSMKKYNEDFEHISGHLNNSMIYNNLAVSFGHYGNKTQKIELLKRTLIKTKKENERINIHIAYQNLIFTLVEVNSPEVIMYFNDYEEYVNLMYKIDVYEYLNFLFNYYTKTKNKEKLEETIKFAISLYDSFNNSYYWLSLFNVSTQIPELHDQVINIYYDKQVDISTLSEVDKFLFNYILMKNVKKSKNKSNKKLFVESSSYIENNIKKIDNLIISVDRLDIIKIIELYKIKFEFNSIKETIHQNELIPTFKNIIDIAESSESKILLVNETLNILGFMFSSNKFNINLFPLEELSFTKENMEIVNSITLNAQEHPIMHRVSMEMTVYNFIFQDFNESKKYYNIFKKINVDIKQFLDIYVDVFNDAVFWIKNNKE